MAKFIEVAAERLGGDRPRRMGYTYLNIKELSRLLDRAPFFGSDEKSMLGRLGGLDPSALTAFVWVGFRNYDRKLTMDDADEIIQKILDNDGRPADIVKMIHEALQESGLLRTEKKADDDEKDEYSRPPLHSA